MTKTLTYPKTNLGVSLALALTLALTPFISFAQVNINSDATGSLDADVDLDATTSDTGLEVEIGASNDTDVEATTTEDTDASTTGETGLSLRLNADGVAITSATDVNTEADLEVYAHNVAAEAEMIEEAETEVTADGKSRVYVTYKHQGELFGIMPIVLNSTTIVTTGGGEVEVESDLPWWSFLATKKNHAASEIESRIKDNPTVMMSAEMEATAAVQAEIIEAVVTELEAHSSLHATLNS